MHLDAALTDIQHLLYRRWTAVPSSTVGSEGRQPPLRQAHPHITIQTQQANCHIVMTAGGITWSQQRRLCPCRCTSTSHTMSRPVGRCPQRSTTTPAATVWGRRLTAATTMIRTQDMLFPGPGRPLGRVQFTACMHFCCQLACHLPHTSQNMLLYGCRWQSLDPAPEFKTPRRFTTAPLSLEELLCWQDDLGNVLAMCGPAMRYLADLAMWLLEWLKVVGTAQSVRAEALQVCPMSVVVGVGCSIQ